MCTFNQFHQKQQEQTRVEHFKDFQQKPEQDKPFQKVSDNQKLQLSRLGLTVKQQLCKMLQDIGEIEFIELFQQIDKNHDGVLDPYEFIECMIFEFGTQVNDILKFLDRIPNKFWNKQISDKCKGEYNNQLPECDKITTNIFSKLLFGMYAEDLPCFNPKFLSIIFNEMNQENQKKNIKKIMDSPWVFLADNIEEGREILRKIDVIITYIQQIFQFIDITSDNSINQYEIASFLLDLDQFSITYPHKIKNLLNFIFDLVDTDYEGSISIKEFTSWVILTKKQIDMESFNAIKIVDADKSGDMSREEFQNFCIEYVFNFQNQDFTEYKKAMEE